MNRECGEVIERKFTLMSSLNVFMSKERENREVAGKLTEKMKTAWKVLKLSQNYSQFHEDLLNWQHSLSDNESSLVPLYFMAHSG